MMYHRLSDNEVVKGRALSLGRWRVTWHKTTARDGRGRSVSVWHHDKGSRWLKDKGD